MVRDRLVCCIKSNRIKRRLLQETNLTYKKAFEIARAMEVAARDINDLQKQLLHTATVQRLQIQNIKSQYAIDVVTIIYQARVVFDRPNVEIVVKSAILQRFVTVKLERCPRRPQKVKPHIVCHKTHPLPTERHHH